MPKYTFEEIDLAILNGFAIIASAENGLIVVTVASEFAETSQAALTFQQALSLAFADLLTKTLIVAEAELGGNLE